MKPEVKPEKEAAMDADKSKLKKDQDEKPKSPKRSIKLKKETLRELTDKELGEVAGGSKSGPASSVQK